MTVNYDDINWGMASQLTSDRLQGMVENDISIKNVLDNIPKVLYHQRFTSNETAGPSDFIEIVTPSLILRGDRTVQFSYYTPRISEDDGTSGIYTPLNMTNDILEDNSNGIAVISPSVPFSVGGTIGAPKTGWRDTGVDDRLSSIYYNNTWILELDDGVEFGSWTITIKFFNGDDDASYTFENGLLYGQIIVWDLGPAVGSYGS